MEDERFKSDVMVKSLVDGKRYYVITLAMGNLAYLTAAYSTNFFGLVNRRKPLVAIQSPIDVPIDELLLTHSTVWTTVEMYPRSEWQARLKKIAFGAGKSMAEIRQDFEKWLGVDPE